MSGVVEEISDAVAGQTGSKKGDPVMALVGGGGYAGQLHVAIASPSLTFSSVKISIPTKLRTYMHAPIAVCTGKKKKHVFTPT